MKDRLFEIIILLVALILAILLTGCTIKPTMDTYRFQNGIIEAPDPSAIIDGISDWNNFASQYEMVVNIERQFPKKLHNWIKGFLPEYEPQRQIEAKQQEFWNSRPFLMGCTDIGVHSAISLIPWILNFRGYDSHFKFENSLALLQSRPEDQWWPYWGAK